MKSGSRPPSTNIGAAEQPVPPTGGRATWALPADIRLSLRIIAHLAQVGPPGSDERSETRINAAGHRPGSFRYPGRGIQDSRAPRSGRVCPKGTTACPWSKSTSQCLLSHRQRRLVGEGSLGEVRWRVGSSTPLLSFSHRFGPARKLSLVPRLCP